MRTLALMILSTLLLASCGGDGSVETDSSLEGMFEETGSEQGLTEESTEPEETPYSVGPTEIPDDLIPND